MRGLRHVVRAVVRFYLRVVFVLKHFVFNSHAVLARNARDMLILLEVAIEIGLQELFGVHVSHVLRGPHIRALVTLDRGATCGCH